MNRMIRVGEGGAIAEKNIVAVVRANSSPVKRLLESAGPGRVINLTYGYPRKSVVLFDNGFLAIVSLTVEEILSSYYSGEEVF